jgi:hypothetical protein
MLAGLPVYFLLLKRDPRPEVISSSMQMINHFMQKLTLSIAEDVEEVKVDNVQDKNGVENQGFDETELSRLINS